MRTSLTYRTNRDLFSNHYLDEHLPETEAWDAVGDEALQVAYEEITDLWEREKSTAPKRNESQLEEKFVRPMFRTLGIPFEVEESTSRTQRRPDYGFFETEDAARNAFERREDGGDFYANAVAVADAKRWGRPLDTRGSGEHERDFENPSYQIHVYLQETPARWAVLTDGKTWRLYYGPTSHRLDSYYEIDLPTVLETGDLEDFKYFYLFFRHEAFLEDAGGDSFLDDVYDESNVFAQELGADLQDNVYEAITVLSEGFLQHPDNELDEADLDLVHDSSLVYLYRIIFVLYAEAEGRDLLNTDNEIYEQSYSLNSLKQEIADELDGADPTYRDWRDDLWSRLDELFALVDRGSTSRGIPEDDLYIPAYNGGLFRTDPDEDDAPEAQFLAKHRVGDAALARVIELLTRSENDNGGKIFVDYSSLDVRHLGSIYEGLLEYELDVADEHLALDDGEYVSADEGDDVVVQEGEVYLTTDSGEREATGSYYTPEYVVAYVVENTLGPLVDDVRADLVGYDSSGEGGFAEEFAERVFDLTVLDPAMGSGHFLTSAVDYLAREIIDAQERQAAQQGVETVDEEHDINWARRQVAQRCIYGVDLNPLAVELAKVSLWLRTLAADQPLAFLDHHLKTGNSLVGSDVEEIEELESESGGGDGRTTLADFGIAREGTIEQLMRIYQDFVAIENRNLADVKRMESRYDEFERNKLRRRLEAMANVHTADTVGLDSVPQDAYERMAAALENDERWDAITEMQWYRDAQQWAGEGHYFHWKLSFPEVFYSFDGSTKQNEGFDAVIGNPPYLNIERIPDDQADYFRGAFDCAHRRFDAYVLFGERALELTKTDGYHSYIVPDKCLSETYASRLRERILKNHALHRILDLRDVDVFEDATNSPVVYVTQKGTDGDTTAVDRLDERDGTVVETELPTDDFRDVDEYRIRLDWSLSTKRIVETVTADTVPSSRVLYVSWGAQPGNADEFFRYGSKPDSDSARKMIKGGDVDRYSIDFSDSYVLYRPDELHRPAFPGLFENPKLVFREVAGSRGLIGSYDDDGYYTDHSLSNCILKSDLATVDDGTLRERGIKFVEESRENASDSSEKVYDRDAVVYPEDRELSDQFSLKSILGLFSSKLMGFYYQRYVSGDLNVFPQHIRDLPLPPIDFTEPGNDTAYEELVRTYRSTSGSGSDLELPHDARELDEYSGAELHDLLDCIVDDLLQMYDEKSRINTDLRDYLGDYGDGKKLAEIGRYQPHSGVQASPVQGTTREYEKLEVRDANVTTAGDDGLEISVKVRYKPEQPDEHDTDRNGYTYTDFVPAIELFGLTPDQAALVRAFVPTAVEAEIGGLRRSAGKTISPLDRLRNVILPDVRGSRDEIDQYRSAVDEKSALENDIALAETFVDRIAYTLYGLSDDQIETVENATVED